MDRISLDYRSFLTGWILLFLVWLFASYGLEIPRYLLATPKDVYLYTHDNFETVKKAVFFTSSQALVGWLMSLVIGLIIGAIVFYLKWLRRAVLPIIVATQTTPIIALVPLITLWFGYGWIAKTVVACTVAIFPIIIATYNGLSNVKANFVYLFKLAGANEFMIFRKVRLKSAWLTLLPALKVSIVFAVIGSIVAEFMGGNVGLGFLIMIATYGTKSDVLLTAVIFSALIGQTFLISLELATNHLGKRYGELG